MGFQSCVHPFALSLAPVQESPAFGAVALEHRHPALQKFEGCLFPPVHRHDPYRVQENGHPAFPGRPHGSFHGLIMASAEGTQVAHQGVRPAGCGFHFFRGVRHHGQGSQGKACISTEAGGDVIGNVVQQRPPLPDLAADYRKLGQQVFHHSSPAFLNMVTK